MGSYYSQIYPPKSTYSTDQIPDLSGKVFFVTGGNTGIGKETVKALLQHNAKVYLAARSEQKAQVAIADLKLLTGKEAIFHQLDLGNLSAIKKSAEEFLAKETSLNVLYDNAGVMVPPLADTTSDGYDLQFGTNVLGHFYLNKLLLPLLISTAAKDNVPSRVIVVSSSVQRYARGPNPIDFATLKDGPERRKKSSTGLYIQSKLANIIYCQELNKRFGDQGIVTITLDPGNIQSDLQRHAPAFVRAIMNAVMLYPTAQGALTQLYAGTSPEALKLGGKYLVPWARIDAPNHLVNEPGLGEKLWNWLEEQVEGK